MNGPSEKAQAAADRHVNPAYGSAKDALRAAHDPALGLDRSVCLRDVVEWLDAGGIERLHGLGPRPRRVADLVEREFGSGS